MLKKILYVIFKEVEPIIKLFGVFAPLPLGFSILDKVMNFQISDDVAIGICVSLMIANVIIVWLGTRCYQVVKYQEAHKCTLEEAWNATEPDGDEV